MPLSEHAKMDSPAWLRNLRWFLMAGAAVIVAVARAFGADFPSSWIFLTLGGFGLWNGLVPLVERRLPLETRTILFLELLVDIGFISVMFWFSGGLMNPFTGFYIIAVLVGGLLLNSRLIVAVSLFASACVLALIWAPPLMLHGQPLRLLSSPLWYGLPAGLITLVSVTAGFILVFLGRLRRAQERVRQRVKMEALGRLVAGLAHEIGTPLNSILVLAQDLEQSVPEGQRKEMGIIASQARRCGEIVSLLLGYSRTLVRRGEAVKYTPVRLLPWVQETYDLLVAAEAQKFPGQPRPQVEFRMEAETMPAEVAVPELILRQVLENLLKNARDAVQREPLPRISLRIYSDRGEGEWIFIVEDNGPGFSRQERERAFEAFFTTKKQGFGSGLGLYISYYLLSQVGGRIVIEDHSGPGARIRVNLPKLEGLEGQAQKA